MHRRFWIVLLIAALGAVFLQYELFWRQKANDAELQGKLVFAQSFDNGTEVDRIEIITSKGKTELVQNEKSYWLVANLGGYYADFKLMHRFLDSVNKSVYTVRLPYSQQTASENYLFNPEKEKKNSGILIRVYAKEKLLDEIIVGLPDQDERYFFARPAGKEEIWLIDGAFDLPIRPEGWLLNPVLSVAPSAVEAISVDGKTVERETEYGVFYDEGVRLIEAKNLLEVMRNVQAMNVLPEKEFAGAEINARPQKIIKLTTFYGLEFVCTLYYNNEGAVWLNVKLSTTPLPMAAVNDYIKDNRFLYDGWYFEVSPRQRHVLRDFRLE